MKRWLQIACSTMLLLALVTVASPNSGPCRARIDQPIEPVSFATVDGKPFSLGDLLDREAIVVVFLSFECPICTGYAAELAELATEYAEHNVAFIGVNVTGEDAATTAQRVAEYNIPFPVFADPKHSIADTFRAEITPEAFVLDPGLVLRYRGRIDDTYAARLKKNVRTTRQDLKQALDEVLAGEKVSEPVTTPVGCPIRREKPTKTTAGAVTYYRDVLPILQNHCQGCHRPGEVGPFSLLTYKQAVNWASDIKDYTQQRKMPPWKPVAGVAFHNERRLSEREIATLAAWADGGTPEGNPKEAPPPRPFTDGWQLGPPDLVLTVDEDFVLGPDGADVFRCFVLPTNLVEDKYVMAIDVRPGNRRVVHHTLHFIDTEGHGRKLVEKERARAKSGDRDRGAGYSVSMGIGFAPQGGLSGWVPGQVPRPLPPATGFFLPRGSDIVLQVHYHRSGRVEKDRTSIGLYFARKSEGMQRYQDILLQAPFLYIPAGKADFRVSGSVEIKQDMRLHSVVPHMHLLGRKIQVTVHPPDETETTIVAINDWDYNWQETYSLKEPILMKPGTKVRVEAVFDNSADNPNNPFQPPRAVRFGEQTTSEMCFVFMGTTTGK